MDGKSVVPFIADASSFDSVEGDVPSIATSPKGASPMDVACVLDVPTLASFSPVGNHGEKVAIEGCQRRAVFQPPAPVIPRTSCRSSSLGKARKPQGHASGPYQRRPEVRSQPVVTPPPLMIPPPRTNTLGTSGVRGCSIPVAPSSPPPVLPSGKPRVATLDKKSTRVATLEKANEDFKLGSSSTPRASRKSREKTRAAGRSPKTPTTAKLVPLVEHLSRECEKLRSISAEQKMDLAEHRDDLHDLHHGLCAKMRRLFVATRHEDLYDAE
jgi:hypothetical protein